MPKIVDHEERRAELARAVWAVIGRHGIEGATVRRVAEQAGLSMGGLRHYFDNQQGLLRFAALAVGSNVSARMTAVQETDHPPAERAQLMIETLLPLDEQRRVEAEVWLACLVRSRIDDSLEELRLQGWAGTRHICRLAVELRCGQVSEEKAQDLHTFVDGLTLQAVTYPELLKEDDLRAAVRRQVTLLKG